MNSRAAFLLQSRKLRQTRPRLQILSVLLKATEPITQDQIAEHLGSETPNKTTIYRTLILLGYHDLVHEVFVRGRAAYYELAHHCGEIRCHPHFTCERCHRTTCMTDSETPMVSDLPAGYVICRQQVRLEGICPDCRDETVRFSR